MNPKYKIRLLEPSESSIWDEFIDRSENGTIFHKYGWMQAAENHSKTRFYPLVCEKSGEGIISVFPIFTAKKIFFKILFSPPPGCAIPELGPVFYFRSSKQHRIEADLNYTIEAYDSYIKKNYNPDYYYILNNLQDVRPYKWLRYSVEPGYTYRLYLDKNYVDLFNIFDKRIRNRINKIQNNGSVEIINVGSDKVHKIINEIKTRYSELSRSFNVSAEYVGTLLDIYGNQEMKLYECISDGSYQTSFITLEYKNNMKFWLGGVQNNTMKNGVNETIHWHNIVDASKRSLTYYERIGANTKHLCENKSKYGFRPDVYYKVEKWTQKGFVFHYLYDTYIRKNRKRD